MKAIILLAWANLVTAQLLDNSNLPQCVVRFLLYSAKMPPRSRSVTDTHRSHVFCLR